MIHEYPGELIESIGGHLASGDIANTPALEPLPLVRQPGYEARFLCEAPQLPTSLVPLRLIYHPVILSYRKTSADG